MAADAELPYYAATLRGIVWPDGDPDRAVVGERLVVVRASGPEDARRESGLIEADFHPATDDELDAWDAITAAPLTVKDLRQLVSLVGRHQRRLGNRRRKETDLSRLARFKARKLTELRGKLETMLDDAEDIDEEEVDGYAHDTAR